MRRVKWSALAIIDLEDIDDYWMEYSENAAETVATKIERAAQFLATMPGAGPVLGGEVARKWSVATTRYILVYRVMTDAIEILRIRHAKQNWTTP